MLQIDPGSEGALQGTVAGLRKEQKFDKAAAFLAEALLKRPTSRGILSERVWVEVDQRHYAAAICALDDVLRHPGPASAPDNTAELLAWKVSLLRTTARFDEAGAAVRQALQSFPRSIELLIQLAWLHFYQNRLTEAADTFAQVLNTDPENEAALQGKIATLRLQGQFALAKREADEKARTIAARDPWVNLLRTTVAMLCQRGCLVVHVDATVVIERPHVAPVRDDIRFSLAQAIGISPEHVSVKATRGEGMGYIGRLEGVAPLAVVSVQPLSLKTWWMLSGSSRIRSPVV